MSLLAPLMGAHVLDSCYLQSKRRLSSRYYRFATTRTPLIISDISQAINFAVDRASFSENIAGQPDSNKSGYGDSGFRVADIAGIGIPLAGTKFLEKMPPFVRSRR